MWNGDGDFDNDDENDNLVEEVNLQEIIKERRTERKQEAVQKRQVDLQRITDMNSAEGLHPLKIFPKIVWEHILEELDAEDRWSLWHIHPLFRDLMEENRIRDILFPLALRIDEMRRYIRWIAPSDSFPFEWKKYPICIYGGLRQVSKSLRSSVDRWVEDNVQKKVDGLDDGESEHVDNFDYPLIDMMDEEGKISNLKRILASFQGTNPAKHFYPRGINLSIPTYCHQVDDVNNEEHVKKNQIFKEFKNDVTAFLNIIGDQILCLKVMISSFGEREWNWEEVNMAAAYILLQKWTRLMPNLRWILLNGGVRREWFPFERNINFPQYVLLLHPFPRLKSLERVRFHHLQSNPELVKYKLYTIHNAILKANRGISKVNIEDMVDEQLELIHDGFINPCSLSSFSVIHRNRETDEVENFTLTFERIRGYTDCRWMKLKTIELDLYDPLGSLHDTLQFLDDFPTLEKVSLKFESRVRVGHEDTDVFRYLNLPNLTDLELKLNEPDIYYQENMHFFFSLQFLLHSKKLETLRWTLHRIDDGKLRSHLLEHENKANGNLLDFRAGLRVLHESNIWEVFPKLKTVEVEGLQEGKDIEQICEHQYHRLFAGETVSLTQFLASHICSKSYCLSDCVMLYN